MGRWRFPMVRLTSIARGKRKGMVLHGYNGITILKLRWMGFCNSTLDISYLLDATMRISAIAMEKWELFCCRSLMRPCFSIEPREERLRRALTLEPRGWIRA